MWLITPEGFFSAVEKPGDRADGMLTVRTRNRADIKALKRYFPDAKPYRVRYSDYEWRIRVPKDEWAQAVARMALEIDYSNFKNEVTRRQGRERHDIYSRVWSVLLGLEGRRRDWTTPKGKGKGKQQPLFDPAACPNCSSPSYVQEVCGECGYDASEDHGLLSTPHPY